MLTVHERGEACPIVDGVLVSPVVDGVLVPLFGVTYIDGEWEGVRRGFGESEKFAVGGRHALFLCPFMDFLHVLQVLGLPLTGAAIAAGDAAGDAAAAAAAAAPARAARKSA